MLELLYKPFYSNLELNSDGWRNWHFHFIKAIMIFATNYILQLKDIFVTFLENFPFSTLKLAYNTTINARG